MLTGRKRQKVDAEETEVLNKVRKEGSTSKENPFLNSDIIKILAQNAGVEELACLRAASTQYHDAMSKPFFAKLAKTVVINPDGTMRLAWINTVNSISIPTDEITWANNVNRKRRCLTLKNWNSDLASKFQISTILVKDYDFPEDTTKGHFNPEMEQLLQMLEPTVKELRFDYLKDQWDPETAGFFNYRYQIPNLWLPISKFISKFKHVESIQLTFDHQHYNTVQVTPQQILKMIEKVDQTVKIQILFNTLIGNLKRFKTFLTTFSAYSNVKIDFQRVEIIPEDIESLTQLVKENSKLNGFGLRVELCQYSFPQAYVVKTQLGLLSPYLTSLDISVKKNGPDILSGLVFPKLKSLHMRHYHHPIGHGGILPNCPLLDHLWLSVNHKDCIFVTDGEANEMSDLKATFEGLDNLKELKFFDYSGSRHNQKILSKNKYHRYIKILLPRCKVIAESRNAWGFDFDEGGSEDEGIYFIVRGNDEQQ